MFRTKLNWTQLYVCLALSGSLAFAAGGGDGGIDIGNGGNGIKDVDGTVRLVDMVEVGLDPDAVVQANMAARSMSPNFTIQRRVRRIIKNKLPAVIIGHRDDNRIVQALATQLSVLGYRFPTLVNTILDRMEFLGWARPDAPIAKNEDSRLRLELAPGQEEIGCAQNKSGRVLYSSVCETNMSPGNFAALMVHEAIYAYLTDEQRNPALVVAKDSTPIRIIVTEIFSLRLEDLTDRNHEGFVKRVTRPSLNGIEIKGLNELFADDQPISNTFFQGSRSFAEDYNCSFRSSEIEVPVHLQKIGLKLQFRGALYLTGNVSFAENSATTDTDSQVCANQVYGYANRYDAVQSSCLLNPNYQLPQSWVVSEIPSFNAQGGIINLAFVRVATRERLKVTISANPDERSEVEYSRAGEGVDPEAGTYSFRIGIPGSCQFSPPSSN